MIRVINFLFLFKIYLQCLNIIFLHTKINLDRGIALVHITSDLLNDILFIKKRCSIDRLTSWLIKPSHLDFYYFNY
jgi:hypothetical protein